MSQSQPMQVLTSSESNSWYTPPHVIKMVREVLGGIDLDPASHPVPQQWIKATRCYTIYDNGLKFDWKGRVFLNPPYGKTGNRSNQEIWAEKLNYHCRTGQVSAAIMLTKTVPGYKWWDNLFSGGWPSPCCITRDRLSFVRGSDVDELPVPKTGKSKAASTFWYYGDDPELFNKVFSEIGRVIPQGDLY